MDRPRLDHPPAVGRKDHYCRGFTFVAPAAEAPDVPLVAGRLFFVQDLGLLLLAGS